MFLTVQRKINDLRLRSVIYASLAAPLLVLWLVAYYSWASWQDDRVAQLAVVANDMSDQVIAAAGQQAIERGATAGALSAKPEFFFLERYMRAYEAEWRAFVQAVEQGGAMPVTLQDGVNALAVAEAATLSARSGRAVKLSNGRPVLA